MNGHWMYDVYICSSLRNREVNDGLCQFFEGKGLSVYNPGRDTDQVASSRDVFEANCQAISQSRVIVAVLDYYGKDFGFEIGFAHASGKTIAGYSSIIHDGESTMIIQAIPVITSSKEELLEFIRNVLVMA